MKKTLIALVLVLALLVPAFALADIDTSSWICVEVAGSGLTMLIPDDFEEQEIPYTEDTEVFAAGNENCIVEVTALGKDYASLDEIYEEMLTLDYLDDVEIEEVNGVETVEIEGADDGVFGFYTFGEDGETVYCFMFFPLIEDNNDVAEETADAIFESIAPVEAA